MLSREGQFDSSVTLT
nr:unnamed protein product [Callosobruchus chinensis]